MHQPEYRDLQTGEFQLPLTYLHAIKDYIDMAAILEEVPGACAVINFVPILLDQIEDYAAQVSANVANGQVIKDPFLAALSSETPLQNTEQLMHLIKGCLRANEKQLINRFPAYRKLVDMALLAQKDSTVYEYFSEQYLVDILVWYHLVWLGETIRRSDTRVQALIEKAGEYTLEDRRRLMEIISEILTSVIGRYRKLAETGQAELSVTPYAHPMVPLLLDFNSAKEAMPDVDLPNASHYPGGEERSIWHIKQGLESFERHFGFRPRGCWPSEGGVSTATVELLSQYGIEWCATGETVLHNSLINANGGDKPVADGMHRGYQINDNGAACFFRDDGLSDLIGFTYSDWHGDDAVNNFVHHLENVSNSCDDKKNRVVSVILDGENAWESYHENGYHFLAALYKRLSEHPDINLTTYSACLDDDIKLESIPSLVAGSWVYGTFSTWMGDAGKNKGWDLLCAAKSAFDRVMASGRLSDEQRLIAIQQLAACEGSDWFWCFGDYNDTNTVSDFDRLFRLHLVNLYKTLDEPIPSQLTEIISHGGDSGGHAGAMRPSQDASH